MKNKGFTLVELLAVITILGIIITITVVSVSGVINRSSDKAINILKDEIKEAARKYVTDNISAVTTGTNIYAKTLIDEGYLKELKHPDTKNNCYNTTVGTPSSISNDSYISITITETSNGNYKYTYGEVTLNCGD